MLFLKCPKAETLFGFVSIPEEVPRWKRASFTLHLKLCPSCQAQATALRNRLSQFFQPEPDITSSLLKVYRSLQNDPTLILSGWKLKDLGSRPVRGMSPSLSNWLFRGAVVAGAMAAIGWTLFYQLSPPSTPVASSQRLPYAQIRFEDKNSVKVHYVQPELVHSMEFETTGSR